MGEATDPGWSTLWLAHPCRVGQSVITFTLAPGMGRACCLSGVLVDGSRLVPEVCGTRSVRPEVLT
jgi:hypothetical protein